MSAWIREAIVSYVSSFISEYIENFSKSQLRVALWNGSIDFDDLVSFHELLNPEPELTIVDFELGFTQLARISVRNSTGYDR